MPPTAIAAAPPGTRRRVESIDLLRGIVMILMALDHTRDYLGATAINPTDPAVTTVALFFTRWVTHLCAPVFFLLTGTGAWLSHARRTDRNLSRWLFTRGVWLIVLELTVVRCLGYQFNFGYQLTMLVVLWALGWAMIALAGLVFLPPHVVAGIGIAMVALHNLLDPIRASAFGAFAPVWTILHVPGFVVSAPGPAVFAAYPLIPWIGVTAVGYGLGQWYDNASEERSTRLLRLGLALTAAFIVLRLVNVYGDPAPWTSQRSGLFTTLSFLNTTKYPPSLLFLLMTLGPAMLLLSLLDARTPALLRPAVVIGKVPLFYFVLHLPLVHLMATLICLARYGDAHWMFESPTVAHYPITPPPGWGYSLPVVYLAWFTAVVILYPACRWYAGVKRRRTDWWLSYL